MALLTPDPLESRDRVSHAPARLTERVITLVLIGLVLTSALWTLRENSPLRVASIPLESVEPIELSSEMVPLTTGEESLAEIFTRAGCPVCHTIPGIPGAHGQVGPALLLGTTGRQRLQDPFYGGSATTVRDYIIESVLEPDLFIVPGYPRQTMPAWYGAKLSALALEKIAAYLEKQTAGDQTH